MVYCDAICIMKTEISKQQRKLKSEKEREREKGRQKRRNDIKITEQILHKH